MANELKINAFEYVLYKLDEWYKEKNTSSEEHNDISILKALKLLFFISAVDSRKDSDETLLDVVFNNFVAMPYGHVESDVYSNIKNNSHNNITIDNNKATITNLDKILELKADVKTKIDNSIIKLKGINAELINMSAFELVELSHSWYSWKIYFAKAKRNNTNRESIPNEIIKSEEKIFFIN